MVSINRSFFYGICFASITWSISLYLLYQLHRIDIQDLKVAQRSVGVTSGTLANGQFKNSDDLLRKLQPVRAHVSLEEKEQGLSMLGMIKSPEDQHVRDEGYRVHAFNVLISNRIALNRTIPDTRNSLCKDISYSTETLPSVSVVICFYNEHLTTLLRSIQSVFTRTPAALLHQVILVDDHSDLGDVIGAELQRKLDQLFSGADNVVQLFRNAKREGLIRSRVIGSRKCTGDVLVFLDSHVEVNVGWLEPLLARIQENRTRVLMPIIDIINADTFAYSASPLVRGGFNWGLHFKWENLPKGTLSKPADFIAPIKSPTMAGGLFAMDRRYFIEMGEYDEGMDIWGGENLEISFRIWMCGGSLELSPCSRVGHVFRARRPYGDPADKHAPATRQNSMARNSLRVAHVWMDEYKSHYMAAQGQPPTADYGDISSRVHLRTALLHCKPFAWYLEHVYPEQVVPHRPGDKPPPAALEPVPFQPWHSRKRDYQWHGQLRLTGRRLCIAGDRQKRGKGSLLTLAKCATKGNDLKNQTWWTSGRGELLLGQLLCLQAGQQQPHLHKCHEMGGDQQWQYNERTLHGSHTPIYNMAAGRCLGVPNTAELGARVELSMCNDRNGSLTSWDMLSMR